MAQRRTLHVGLVVSPFARVPPEGEGDSARLATELARGLLERGHRLTLVATGDSRLEGAEPAWIFPTPLWPPESMAEWNQAVHAASVFASGGVDVVLSLLPPFVALAPLLSCPVVHLITHDHDPALARLYATHPEVRFLGIGPGPAQTLRRIPLGLDPALYTLGAGDWKDALYLGLLDAGGGAHRVLEATQKAGLPLRIAGQTTSDDYFEAVLSPRLLQGGAILCGQPRGEARKRLLGTAGVFVFAPLKARALPLVAVEAMLSGTPVVTLEESGRGLIDEGVTGFTAPTLDEMPGRLREALKLDRRRVREEAGRRFAADTMLEALLAQLQEASLERGPRPSGGISGQAQANRSTS